MTMGKISQTNDPMGAAIKDFYEKGVAARLRVMSTDFDEDELPVETLFRTIHEMPVLDQQALSLCRGRVLDVGAGAGCHSLALQEKGLEVTAIDISPFSVDVMNRRGVRMAHQVDLFDEGFVGCYDTVLMLMNGSGIIGRLERMPLFFRRMKQLLAPDGCILMDSTDLRYIFEDEEGVLDIDLNAGYYGELDFQMQYKRIKGAPFDWLYVDFSTLAYHAEQNGFVAELVAEGEHYDYLARLIPKQ
ncbi:MAG: class I SAM-dependent methyltransferase [Paraprevotella sp.]|nr:class I SAM-dependent methyltransferase [Paraprevotella sp.]